MITFFNKGNKWKDYIKNLNDEEWPDKREPETIRRNASVFFPRILNEFLASNPIELNSDIDLTIKKDYGNYNKWLSKSEKFKLIKKLDIGPNDFKITKKQISSLEPIFENLLIIYFKNPKFLKDKEVE